MKNRQNLIFYGSLAASLGTFALFVIISFILRPKDLDADAPEYEHYMETVSQLIRIVDGEEFQSNPFCDDEDLVKFKVMAEYLQQWGEIEELRGLGEKVSKSPDHLTIKRSGDGYLIEYYIMRLNTGFRIEFSNATPPCIRDIVSMFYELGVSHKLRDFSEPQYTP